MPTGIVEFENIELPDCVGNGKVVLIFFKV